MSRKYFFSIAIIVLIALILIIRVKIINYERNTISYQPKVKSATTDFLSTNNIPNVGFFSLPPAKLKGTNNPAISVESGILIDNLSFYPLWQKDSHKRVAVASLTKIMTAIVVFENYQFDDTIEISQKAAGQIGSDINLRKGEKLTINSLLKALLVQSANDAAYALAEKIGLDNFVNKMNEKAQWLGLKNTHFLDPAGLDDNGYSTAFDLSVITSYALKNNLFSEIVKSPEIVIYSTDSRFEHKLENSNRLIKNEHPLYLPYVIGVKTGFTPQAGHCLIAATNKNDRTLISVLLNTNLYTNEASAVESNKLLEWGYRSYKF